MDIDRVNLWSGIPAHEVGLINISQCFGAPFEAFTDQILCIEETEGYMKFQDRILSAKYIKDSCSKLWLYFKDQIVVAVYRDPSNAKHFTASTLHEEKRTLVDFLFDSHSKNLSFYIDERSQCSGLTLEKGKYKVVSLDSGFRYDTVIVQNQDKRTNTTLYYYRSSQVICNDSSSLFSQYIPLSQFNKSYRLIVKKNKKLIGRISICNPEYLQVKVRDNIARAHFLEIMIRNLHKAQESLENIESSDFEKMKQTIQFLIGKIEVCESDIKELEKEMRRTKWNWLECQWYADLDDSHYKLNETINFSDRTDQESEEKNAANDNRPFNSSKCPKKETPKPIIVGQEKRTVVSRESCTYDTQVLPVNTKLLGLEWSPYLEYKLKGGYGVRLEGRKCMITRLIALDEGKTIEYTIKMNYDKCEDSKDLPQIIVTHYIDPNIRKIEHKGKSIADEKLKELKDQFSRILSTEDLRGVAISLGEIISKEMEQLQHYIQIEKEFVETLQLSLSKDYFRLKQIFDDANRQRGVSTHSDQQNETTTTTTTTIAATTTTTGK